MKTTCDACDSNKMNVMYKLDRIPAFQNKLFETSEKAEAATVARVQLCHCPSCDLIFNAAFDNRLMDYDEGYQNSQDHSPVFREYLEKVAAIVTRNADIATSTIVEIGCGKGYFLNCLSDSGYNVTGFDPTFEGDDARIVKKYFNKETAVGVEATHVIMRHTLEHIERPYDFLHDITQLLSPEAQLYIEVPRFEWILENNAFWDIFHEHCNYFTERFFQRIFGGAATVHRTFNDQYMIVETRVGALVDRAVAVKHLESNEFSFEHDIDKFRKNLDRASKNYVWGAGAKGIAFCNILDPERQKVTAVVDINPAKQGNFVPLSGHPCTSPSDVDWATLDSESCLWIMNENYAEEIVSSLPNDRQFKIITLGQME